MWLADSIGYSDVGLVISETTVTFDSVSNTPHHTFHNVGELSDPVLHDASSLLAIHFSGTFPPDKH